MDNNFTQDFLGTGAIRVALTGVLAILALFLFAETASIAQDFGRPNNPATDTITVSGMGTATLAPDIAHISFSVQNTAPAVADAQTATTKQTNAALAFIKEQGIAEKDVKTLSYNIAPQYTYPHSGVPTLTGYEVSETIQVTVRDLATTGALLEGVGKLGVQNVNGPNFALDDANAGTDAARADAINNAKQQANILAQQLGVRLGKIVNFSESSGGYPYPVMYGAMDASKSSAVAAPQVPTGENTYNASVSITYEIR